MKDINFRKYNSYIPKSHEEWKSIMREEMEASQRFEIHCWNEENEEIKNALKFGNIKECDWAYGKVIEGTVNEKFKEYILKSSEPENKEVFDKKTHFFSIFLDNGFSSEHYGTELHKIEKC